MPTQKRIPIPISRRLKHLRAKLLPFIIFGGAATLTVILWMRHSVMPNGWGAVEAIRYDLGSHVDGTLAWDTSPNLELYSRVLKGEIVARLDDRPAQAAIKVVQAEHRQLESQLAATSLEAKLGQFERAQALKIDRRRLELDIERLKLELLDRDALIAVDKIDLDRRNEKVRLTEELVKKQSQTAFELFTETMRRDIVSTQIEGNGKARAEAATQLTDATKRLGTLPPIEDPEFDLLLAPIRAGMAVQTARMRELELQVESLKIIAPISGTVVAIYRRRGQAVVTGEPILTIAKETPERIVAYIRPTQRIAAEPGLRVHIRRRSSPTQIAETSIETVGPQVELIPPQHLTNPSVPEWGLPVSISLPPDLKLIPGEIVELTFRR